MRSIEEIQRDNAGTWAAVIDKLRAMGHWVVVEYAPGPFGTRTIESVQAVPARDATNAAADLSGRVPCAHTIAILPPTREPVLTLGDYVRQCEERARFDVPANYGGTD